MQSKYTTKHLVVVVVVVAVAAAMDAAELILNLLLELGKVKKKITNA